MRSKRSRHRLPLDVARLSAEASALPRAPPTRPGRRPAARGKVTVGSQSEPIQHSPELSNLTPLASAATLSVAVVVWLVAAPAP